MHPSKWTGFTVPGGRLSGFGRYRSPSLCARYRRCRPWDFHPGTLRGLIRSYMVTRATLPLARGRLALPAVLIYHIPVRFSSTFSKKFLPVKIVRSLTICTKGKLPYGSLDFSPQDFNFLFHFGDLFPQGEHPLPLVIVAFSVTEHVEVTAIMLVIPLDPLFHFGFSIKPFVFTRLTMPTVIIRKCPFHKILLHCSYLPFLSSFPFRHC